MQAPTYHVVQDAAGDNVHTQPDDSVPTQERQAALHTAYQRNISGPGTFRERVFHIRTRGELRWLMQEQGWSGAIDDGRSARVFLTGVNFSYGDFRGMHLYLACFLDSWFPHADLRDAVLIGADLQDTSFERTNLAGAHLVGAYLTHARIRRANLQCANLQHTDLSHANLSGADLRGAKLFGANLTHTNLSGADLRGADIRTEHYNEQTQINGIRVDATTSMPYLMIALLQQHAPRSEREEALLYICPVCGYPDLDDPPRSPSGGGSYEICPSCGFEFGVTDDDQGFTYAQWRAKWVDAGMPWQGYDMPKPLDWNPVAQLQRLSLSNDSGD